MYIYNNYDNNILKVRLLEFKFYLINYLSGRLNEFLFKTSRLQNGLYRQRFSYMCRFAIPYGSINIYQLNLFSYISIKYDKFYMHLTTRTNIQFNWINILEIIEILEKLNFLNIHSIQTSGNCVRNITINHYNNIENYQIFKTGVFAEIIRQWFTLNYEFLFLPRKFKIAITNKKNDDISLKIHDLGLIFKKNKLNKLIFNILIGGGLGRTPIVGSYLFKNLHWKNILNYCDKIIRIYNIYGFRNNIYKSRIKILLKSINCIKFSNFIKSHFNVCNNFIYILNEKELNLLLIYFDDFKLFDLKLVFKKIKYNNWFLEWIKFNVYPTNIENQSTFDLPIKTTNLPSGDINIFQIKSLVFFSNKFYCYNLNITNKQNIVLNDIFSFFLYNFYIKLKKYFFNIFNGNLLTGIVCCPGLDFCSLANSRSIFLSNIIHKFFFDYKTLVNIKKITISISGCVNSCSHHHTSNIGVLGIKKNVYEFYQIYLGGSSFNYNSIKLGKFFSNSTPAFGVILLINKIIKFFLKNRFDNEVFIDTYERLGSLSFKNYIF